jgi:glutathione S-transferase
MIQLHYLPGAASMAPQIVLEELGCGHALLKVDHAGGQLGSPAYRQLNPNGLVPVLVDGDLVLYESAAICLHLADSHPAAGLLPALGTLERAQAYKWMVWLTGTLQPATNIYFYPDRWADSAEAIAQVKAHADQRVMALVPQIEAQLASHGGPWLLGQTYGLPDVHAMMLCRWTRNFAGPKARDLPHIGAWLLRMVERPAVQRVIAAEGLTAPWF